MSKPLVTCICPTTNRRLEWLPKIVDCFQRQDYANKEMVIVAPPNFECDWLAPLAPTIRVVAFTGPLGAKRNFGCEEARGQVIAHFDDDDWSSPRRLTHQVGRLFESGMPATGYSEMKFTDGVKWWLYRFGGDGLGDKWPLGTSLCFLKSYWLEHPFCDTIQIGEDNLFINDLRQKQAIDIVPCENRMYANVHLDNLNQRNYDGDPWIQLPATEAIR